MKFDKNQVERFLKSPDPRITAILFYGPDEGLVHERAQGAVKAVLGSLDDPFRLAEFNGAQAKDDIARLSDELNALSMMGGRRVVRISQATNQLGGSLEDLLAAHTSGEAALLVVEGGDLGSKGELAKLFEELPHTAAAACYHDSEESLSALVQAHLKAQGFSLKREALDYLIDHLGGDRGVTRAELDKLILYMGAEKRDIELADVQACIGDLSDVALDDLISAVASGNLKEVDRLYDRSVVEMPAIVLMRSMARHFQRLHLICGRMEAGENFERIAATLRPPLFWSMKAAMQAQARLWSSSSLARALELLIEGEALAMRQHALSDPIARRTLSEIASLVARQRSMRM